MCVCVCVCVCVCEGERERLRISKSVCLCVCVYVRQRQSERLKMRKCVWGRVRVYSLKHCKTSLKFFFFRHGGNVWYVYWLSLVVNYSEEVLNVGHFLSFPVVALSSLPWWWTVNSSQISVHCVTSSFPQSALYVIPAERLVSQTHLGPFVENSNGCLAHYNPQWSVLEEMEGNLFFCSLFSLLSSYYLIVC